MRILAVSLMVAVVSFTPLRAQQTGGSIDLPAAVNVVLRVEGAGVQIYTCTSTPAATKWVLNAPDAKLMDSSGQSIGSHFAGPTWKLDDGSQVQGELIASKPAPDAGSVAWLLLRAKAGSATGTLAKVAFIRRTATNGGVAPASGCESAQDAGKTTRVPYAATYSFYSGPAAN